MPSVNVNEVNVVNYSTSQGRWLQFLHRCREICKTFWFPVILLGAVVALGVLNATINLLDGEKSAMSPDLATTIASTGEVLESINGTRFKFANSRLIYDSAFVSDTEGKRFPSREDFEFLQVDPVSIEELEIHSVILDASLFSNYIQGLSSLRSVKFKNVQIIGRFSRIHLPNLEKFYMDQVISPKEKLTDYKEREQLKSLLFFDKTENQSWDLTKDFAVLGTELEVFIDGSKVLVANKTKSEIALTMSYCNEFLNNIPWVYDTLVLGNCTVNQGNIPTNLKSLLMGNVGIRDGSLETVLKSMTSIQSFSGSMPNLKIHLSNLPSSLTFLCLTGITLEYDRIPTDDGMTQIKQVAFGDNLAPRVISQFDKIFPNVDIVGIFGKGDKSYQLLHNVLKTSAKLIVIEFFPRELHPKSRIAQAVEAYLQKIGVGKQFKNFVLRDAADESGNRIGAEISESENYFYRFTMLGWAEIDTYQKFLRVIQQGKVDEESVDIKMGKGIGGIGGEKWPLVAPTAGSNV